MLRLAVTLTAIAAPGLGVAACGGGGESGGSQEVVTFQRPPPAPKQPALRLARARLFTLRVPAGWTREDSALAGGLERSEWRDPAAPGTSVLVDAIAAVASEPADRARRNRDRGAAKAGYRERALRPAELGGRPAYLWDYELSGRRVVDYFLNDCGDGFAIQGTGPPAGFDRGAQTFRAVAASLRSTRC